MTTLIQRSFTGGELAPSLHMRVDTTKYASGARTLRNCQVMRHGGATSRSGTDFVAEVKDSTKPIRFIKFVFNSDQTYVLEFGHLYMRVHKQGVQLALTPQSITAVTNANPGVLTYSGADTYANGDEVQVSGIVGPIGDFLNNRNFKVAGVNTTANTFQLNYLDGTAVDTTTMGAYTSGGQIAEVYEITTPYVYTDLSTLRFVQSADVITIVHPNYAPMDLARTGHTSWALAAITFAPSIAAPTGASTLSPGGACKWVITAISSDTFEESLPSNVADANTNPTDASPAFVSWTGVTGAQAYNVYRNLYGYYEYIGTTQITSFTDNGALGDATKSPPVARNPFASSGNYPSAVSYMQQRRMFANTNNATETVFGSRTAKFKNFTNSFPIQDDDAITFSLVGRQVNAIKHLLDLGRCVAFTASGVWSIEGDPSGILTPTQINPKQQSYNGCGDIAPIMIGGSAVYQQARGSIIRDLGFELQSDGYRGNDLTIFSAHLFDGFTIVDWDYQETPHSIVYAVRNDGTLLGMTYVREQQIVAWHHHDFSGGVVENVCVVPEGSEDAVYVLVNRTINGVQRRYIERMNSRRITDIVDYIAMDAALTYDGRNTNPSLTMTLSGGVNWDDGEQLTLTSSAAYFSASKIGNEIHLTDVAGDLVRLKIEGYTSPTVVIVRSDRLVPVALRSASSYWSEAVDDLSGLWHIEGEKVSIFGDGEVVASPNNAQYDVITVQSGKIHLASCYSVIHVGLPFMVDIETLSIDMPQGETLADKKKDISAVVLAVEDTRGMFVGGKPPTNDSIDPLEGLFEPKGRQYENYDDTPGLVTDTIIQNILPGWKLGGRVFIRQVDPLPMTVLAVAPKGIIPVPR